MSGFNTNIVRPVGGTAPDSFAPSASPETGTGAPLGLKSVASGRPITCCSAVPNVSRLDADRDTDSAQPPASQQVHKVSTRFVAHDPVGNAERRRGGRSPPAYVTQVGKESM